MALNQKAAAEQAAPPALKLPPLPLEALLKELKGLPTQPPPPTSFLGRAFREIRALETTLGSGSDAEKRTAVVALIDYLQYRNPQLKARILRALGKSPAEALTGLRQALRDTRPAVVEAALLCLGCLEARRGGDSQDAGIKAIAARLSTLAPDGRIAAFQALRYIGTEPAKAVLIAELKKNPPDGDGITTELGWFPPSASSDRLTASLVQGIFGKDAALRAASLLSPWWLLKHLNQPYALAAAVRYGYLDADSSAALQRGDKTREAVVRKLIEHFGLATADLCCALGRSRDAESQIRVWELRQMEIKKALFTDEQLEGREPLAISLAQSPEGAVDRQLFFSALRELDFSNLEEKREPRPFDHKHEQLNPGLFYFRSLRAFEAEYIPRRVMECRKLLMQAGCGAELADTLLPYAVFDRALQDTETRAEKSAELSYMFKSRWLALGRVASAAPGEWLAQTAPSDSGHSLPDRLNGFLRIASRTNLKYAVIDKKTEDQARELMRQARGEAGWRLLSAGSQAALRLWAYHAVSRFHGSAAFSLWHTKFLDLQREEAVLRGQVPPYGVELQNTTLPQECCYAWKQALESWGIPSPRRPEFFALTEAALPPAWSCRAGVLSLRALLEMGFCRDYHTGLNLHISVEGDLGAEAPYLALGLMSMNRSGTAFQTADQWYRAIARVMSKGLIHRNDKSVAAAAGCAVPACHTEIRVLRLCPAEQSPGRLLAQFHAAATAASELGMAAHAFLKQSKDLQCSPLEAQVAGIWRQYRDNLAGLHAAARFGGFDLLSADWFESTGDPRDTELVRNLPIVQLLWERAQFLAGRSGLSSELQAETVHLLMSAAQSVKTLRAQSRGSLQRRGREPH